MKKLRNVALAALFGFSFLTSYVAVPTTSTTTTAQAKTLHTVKLAKTTDGDTASFIYKGKTIKVRFLLVDTPETVHPSKGTQPFGKEASNYTKSALKKAKKIQLDFDKNGFKGDKYGRKLAYVYIDGKDLNLQLVRKGYARVAYIYSPNTTNKAKYLNAQAKAKKEKLRIWSKSGYVTTAGFNAKKKTVVKTTTTKKTTTFKNCTELRKVYPNGVPKSHKAYDAKMDRDKDGYACEK